MEKDKKTLYLSDLDGTLLRPNAAVSEYTSSVLNRLIGGGTFFSYATARPIETAGEIMKGVDVRLPVIIHNGVHIYDSQTRQTVYSRPFTKEQAVFVLSAFTKEGLCPVVKAYLDGKPRNSFMRRRCSREQWAHILSHAEDDRLREVFAEEQLLDGETFYFFCIEEEKRLRPVYEACKDDFRCFFLRDIYTGDMWLEIMEKRASKAAAAMELKQRTGCGRLVCFGDDVNDIPMFEIADESYAVQNAAEELKAAATGIIGANANDGVARFLEERILKA